MKRKKMNKKGMFFTILAIALLSLLLASMTVYSFVRDRSAVNKRIESMNSFVSLIEQDLPRKLYISGFRIIFLMEKRILREGDYIDDVYFRFNETFFNGTLYGEANNETNQLMEDSTFSGIRDSLNMKAGKININIEMDNPVLVVNQQNPWHVMLNLTMDLIIKDNSNLALWNKTSYSIIANVPIKTFEDPIYIIETGGLVTNKINQTIYSIPIGISNLASHNLNSYYINSSSGPSFLNRLEGNFSSDEDGIESLVYLPKLSSQGISGKIKSVVDYIYFDDTNNPPSQNIVGMPVWFYLDNEHINSGDYV